MPDPRSACFRKKRYPSEATAKQVARKVLMERGTRLRVYVCEACGGYHLTHLLDGE